MLNVVSQFNSTGVFWKREWQPTPLFLPGKPHRQTSLMGYNSWGPKSQTQLSS